MPFFLKFPVATALSLGFATAAIAQTTDSELRENPDFTASNYSLYPVPDQNVTYTSAPEGYKPFYISHYGRHGSRFHASTSDYKYVYETLAMANAVQELTSDGQKLLLTTEYLNNYAIPHAGDLTQVGVQQHEGIANRMFKNFPEVFRTQQINGANVVPQVNAYASTSGRCIVSMSAFTGELRSQAPEVSFRYESSKTLMPSICPFNWNDISYSKVETYTSESDKLWQQIDAQPLMQKLFLDSAYAAENIDANKFFNKMFEIRASMLGMDSEFMNTLRNNQGGDVLDSLFTIEESITRWKAQNAWWYSLLGTSPLISNPKGVGYGKGILQHILTEAEIAISVDTSQSVSEGLTQPIAATLRFGHDGGLLPLTALMQLDFANAKVSELSNLHEQWCDFKVIPMAANMQIVFYKAVANESNSTSNYEANEPKPILVKLLYNEIEQNMPIPCGLAESAQSIANATTATATTATAQAAGKDCPAAPYYRWEDFRNFYTEIVDN